MDDQYYRKPKLSFAGRIKKTLKRKNLLVMAFIGTVVLSFMMFSNRGILQRFNLESQRREMLEKIEQARQEQHRLQEQSHALDNDPKAIEKVAREKYGMIREGETVYRVKKDR